MAPALPAHAQQPPTAAEIDAIFAEWDVPGSPGCVLGVLRDGEWLHRKGYGVRRAGGRGGLNPSTTLFPLGTGSKQFVAVAAALLAVEGRLALDADVRVHVPELPSVWPPITPRQLIHHTAGVPDVSSRVLAGDDPGEMPPSLEEWVTLIAREPTLDFPPGSWYRYSLAGYHVLALAVERASGESLRTFVDRRILGPLDMRDSRTLGRVPEIQTFAASRHRVSPEGLIVRIPDLPLGWETHLTLDGLRRWSELISGDAVGGEALAQVLASRYTLPHGETMSNTFGIRAHEHRGVPVIQSGQRAVGVSQFLLHLPDEGLSVFCLCNLETIDSASLVEEVLELFGVWREARR
jgi:CubicO group peptidase (beta-lactamase class C family)